MEGLAVEAVRRQGEHVVRNQRTETFGQPASLGLVRLDGKARLEQRDARVGLAARLLGAAEVGCQHRHVELPDAVRCDELTPSGVGIATRQLAGGRELRADPRRIGLKRAEVLCQLVEGPVRVEDVRVRCQPDRLAAQAAEGTDPCVTVREARLEGANSADLDRLVLRRPHAAARVGVAAERLDLSDQSARSARLQRPAIHRILERFQADPFDRDASLRVGQSGAPRPFDQPAQPEDGDPIGQGKALLRVVRAQPRPLAQELRDADPA